jgi:hypothetical protein
VIRRTATPVWPVLVVAAAAGACADLVGIPERYYRAADASSDGAAVGGDGAAGGDVFVGDDQTGAPDRTTTADQHAPEDTGPSGADAPPNGDGGIPSIPDASCPFCTDAGLCVLACDQDNPTSIAIDSTRIYWTDTGHAANGYAGEGVMQIDKTGANPTAVSGPAMARPTGVVASGGCVFWDEALKGRIIEWCNGTSTALATNMDAGASFTVSGTTLVWATNSAKSDEIAKCVLPGCSGQTTLAGNRTSPFAPGVDDSTPPQIYWLEGSSVLTCSSTACSPTTATPTPAPALSLVMVPAGSYVYTSGTVGQTDGTISFYFLPVGTTTLQVSGRSLPSGIASDGTSICWAEPGSGNNGEVFCCDLNYSGTCTPKTLATGLALPRTVAIDATKAYWVNQGAPDAATGSVMSSPR